MNDYNATASATFLVIAPDLEPDIVTKALGMFPSRAARAGEPLDVRRENGQPILLKGSVSKYGYWKAFIPEALMTAPLEAQLDYWQEILGPKQVQIAQLADRGWEVAVDCFFSVSSTELIELPADVLRAFGQLGINLDIHVFSYEESGDIPSPARQPI